jgi:hypothetical protein
MCSATEIWDTRAPCPFLRIPSRRSHGLCILTVFIEIPVIIVIIKVKVKGKVPVLN